MENNVIEIPFVEIPEEIVIQGLEMCPLKSKDEVEDEFNEWLTNIGAPDSTDAIIEKYLFFCKIKGEAINI